MKTRILYFFFRIFPKHLNLCSKRPVRLSKTYPISDFFYFKGSCVLYILKGKTDEPKFTRCSVEANLKNFIVYNRKKQHFFYSVSKLPGPSKFILITLGSSINFADFFYKQTTNSLFICNYNTP